MSVHGESFRPQLNSKRLENSRGVEDLRENKSFWETPWDHRRKYLFRQTLRITRVVIYGRIG